jgi:hypothetical protein
MMATRIAELQIEQAADRKTIVATFSKIDKQLKLLRDYRIEPPPPPASYTRLAAAERPSSSRDGEVEA